MGVDLYHPIRPAFLSPVLGNPQTASFAVSQLPVYLNQTIKREANNEEPPGRGVPGARRSTNVDCPGGTVGFG